MVLRAQLLKYWDRLRSSFWFLPTIMAAGAVGLAFGTVGLDEVITERWLRTWGWVYSGGPAGASAVLQTIAGSMITIAGVVFSLTLVALSLASSQFGPRLLRNFMRDTANQLVLGTFIATFLYCLLVLRTIRRADEVAFVPHLSVTMGVVFALASLWVLIYFIHHVAVSVQADEIVARVDADLGKGIARLFPEQMGRGTPRPAAGWSDGDRATFDRESHPVAAPADGYLQLIDADALLKLATQQDVVIRVERRPGHYIVMGSPLAVVSPGERVSEDFADRVGAAFVLGNQRRPAQDIEFTVNQLVEIGVRALSPGVNDPFTAIVCVDRLGSALCRLARREMPSPYRMDERDRLRVVVPPVTFPDIADAAFNQLRQHARSSAAVTIRLLEAIAAIAAAADRPGDRAALQRHADMIARGARDGLQEPEDRRAVEERYETVSRVLRKSEPESPPL